jgi:hypothetical protein
MGSVRRGWPPLRAYSGEEGSTSEPHLGRAISRNGWHLLRRSTNYPSTSSLPYDKYVAPTSTPGHLSEWSPRSLESLRRGLRLARVGAPDLEILSTGSTGLSVEEIAACVREVTGMTDAEVLELLEDTFRVQAEAEAASVAMR